jgi:hypothetical protein
VSFLLYISITGAVLFALSKAAEEGEALSARISTGLFASPFVAWFVGVGLQWIGYTRLGGELCAVVALVFVPSWLVAALIALIDVGLGVASESPQKKKD